VIVADDGSTDDTIQYLEGLEGLDVILLKNSNSGVHYQTNSIIKTLRNLDFDVCFKVDDDVYFKKTGWDNLYLEAIKNSGYEHLVYHNDDRKKKFIPKEKFNNKVKASTDFAHVLGCFYTLTPNILNKVGCFDVETFGKQESGHIDYTYRCGLAGFNDPLTPFDADRSNEFIGLRWQHNDPTYEHSLPEEKRMQRRSKYDPIINSSGYLNFMENRRIYVSNYMKSFM